MLFDNEYVRSVPDLLASLQAKFPKGKAVWFRGHSVCNWQLMPSLARKQKWLQAELSLIRRFKQNALPFLGWRPASEWEWLFLMQHYRVQTRLLDWTENPLVALYFAVVDNPRQDGCIWCLLPTQLNRSANIVLELDAAIPLFGDDKYLDSYLPTAIATERLSNLKPVAGIAGRQFQRILAQLGVFTITHRAHQSLDGIDDGQHVGRLLISKEAKKSILTELTYLGMTRLTLFPDLDSVAMVAQEILR